MVAFCMAPGCSNKGYKKVPDISYHRLPLRDKEKLGAWLNAMKLKTPPVSKYSLVCSEHFESDCFQRDFRAELMGAKTKRLLKDSAVPTLFDFSKCSKKATVNARPSASCTTARSQLKSTEQSKRGDRLIARDHKKAILEIHKSIDMELKRNVEEVSLFDINPCCTLPTEVTTPQPLTVSVAVQTDDLPSCAAPCCNGDPPKCSSPCCVDLDHCQDFASTPIKRRPNAQPLEPDCSFFSDISNFENDISNFENHSSYDVTEDSDNNDNEGSDEGSDRDNETTPVDDVKYIVFNNSLNELFKKCQGDNFCTAPVIEMRHKHRGSMVIVEGTCLNNHDFTWRSQPVVRRVPVGNLLLASAVLYTGNTYTTLSEICETMKLKIISKTQFYTLQKEYMLPTINNMWKCHQEQVLSDYVGGSDLVVAGDGRCDSPGHSATFGTYSLMDVNTNLILATNIVKVTEVKNSYNMENEGLIRCLSELQQADVSVSTLATDRHPQISKTMRDKYPNINHQYDVWHLAKSLGKKLNASAKRKECQDLQPWVKSVKNHLWWSADTCDGDVTQLKERWLSILRHIVNKHEWTVASAYTKCDHGELTTEEERGKAWLKPGSPSHKALQTIVCDKRLLKDIELITEFCHTGDLEVFHNVLLKYVPKRLAFSYEGTVARTLLAVMDSNMNTGRTHAETKEGEKRFKIQWSKGSQNFVVKKVKNPKDLSFREDLLKATLDRLTHGTDSKDGAIMVPEDARNAIGKTDKPNKRETVENHVTRFRTS